MRHHASSRYLALLGVVVRFVAAATTVTSTALIIAANDNDVAKASLGLDAYGIPWAKALIPQSGGSLPALNSTVTDGNYGSIVVLDSVAYDYNGTYRSALTTDQWNQLYAYQSAFQVRMVRLEEFPGPDFESVAAVINKIGGREQMAWFLDFAPDWSATSSYLQHTYIHWMTRSLFVGKRKVYLNTQVDDIHLETDMYLPVNTTFKLRPEDLDAHVTWQKSLNSRLPAGSDYRMELGHNGNGDIDSAVGEDASTPRKCNPNRAVDYVQPPDPPLEFVKPPGTGVDLWPSSFVTYNWSKDCASLDPLAAWFLTPTNLDSFAHVSHTFSHEELDNSTYHDATREISFNQAWLAQMGISQAERFSPQGLIPPAITGLHNADAIQAWVANGIKYAVGDNTRPILVNQQNQYWPLASTVAVNGATGIWIIPRWATTIYYNCYSSDCTLQEWKDTSAGSGTFESLLDNARTTNSRYLLRLQADPYMFHQANLRQTDMPSITVGSQTGKMSLIMSWVETVAQEMVRLTNWPITSLRHDDIATYFINRMTLDACQPHASYTYSADGTSITAMTVSANNTACSVPVPVTIPSGTVSASGGSPTSDNLGNEPPIVWVTLSGSPVTLTLSTPVKLG
ncbi:extracellular serine-rich protein [Metarhizium acridum CQMa 102]|uniref:Extracellular serine-rich protein n=1 Tax=Metarhizium acridum (strain CQMa 102) TaxID=655827 RepID=E9EAX0_METAQ|nr:extracellular serine-rich protein [Metarhizium acridum CQMa 102]EFY86901.1 extracellular serine-rich protein [Metarhizium acridum CQMa 102]